MNTSSGFTVLELLAGIVFLSLLGTLGFDRYLAIKTVHRDHDRKIAINAIHHNLEEVVKPALGGYPRVLNTTQLTAMNESLLVDPKGIKVGESDSDYRYEATGCSGGDVCRGYSLHADLENELDYAKTSPNG